MHIKNTYSKDIKNQVDNEVTLLLPFKTDVINPHIYYEPKILYDEIKG